MTRYTEGDWVKYRNSQAIVASGKVLEIRPDNYLVIGEHDKDPNPDTIDPEKIVGEVK